MPARAKLTPTKRERLLAVLALGETLTAASRTVDVSPQAVRKYARRDPIFAARLRVARSLLPVVDPDGDWIAAAGWLEQQAPDRWSIPANDFPWLQ